MYLPETSPLPPIKLGDPDYDPFCKKSPPGAACSAITHQPGRVDLPDVLRRSRDGRRQIQDKMPEMRAESEGEPTCEHLKF